MMKSENNNTKYKVISFIVLLAIFHFLCIGLTIYYTLTSTQQPSEQPIIIFNRKYTSFYFSWDDYHIMRYKGVTFLRSYMINNDPRQVQVITLSKPPTISTTNKDVFGVSGKFVLNSEPLNRNFASYSYMVNPGSTITINHELLSHNTAVQVSLIVGDDNYAKWSVGRSTDFVLKSFELASEISQLLHVNFGTSSIKDDSIVQVGIDRSEMFYIVYYTKSSSDKSFYEGTYQYDFSLTHYEVDQNALAQTSCNLTTSCTVARGRRSTNVLIVGQSPVDTVLTTLLSYKYVLSYGKIWAWTVVLTLLLVVVDIIVVVVLLRNYVKNRFFSLTDSSHAAILDTSYSYGSVPSSYRN